MILNSDTTRKKPRDQYRPPFIHRRCLAFFLFLLFGCSAPLPPPEPTIENALLLVRDGRLDDAENEIDGVIARGFPNERNLAYTHRGCLRIERGDARGALEDLDKVYKPDLKANLCKGKATALLAYHDLALELLAPLVMSGEDDIESAVLAVRSAFALRRVEQAYQLAKVAIKRYPNDAGLMVLWAQAQVLGGNLTAGLRALEQADYLDPKSAEIPFTRGNVYWALEQFEEAIVAYEESLRRNPQFVDAARNLGIAQIQAGQYGQAVETLRTALGLAPTDVGIMNNLGVALASTGKIVEATSLYEQALEATNDDPRLLNNLVDLYIRQGNLDLARKYLERLLKKEPQRQNAQTRHHELQALEALIAVICLDKHPMQAARKALRAKGWTHKMTLDYLERVVNSPIFSTVLEHKENSCRK